MLALGVSVGGRVVLELPDGRLAWITVLGRSGSAIRIGVEAPPAVGVYRESVWQKVLHERNPGTATGPVLTLSEAQATDRCRVCGEPRGGPFSISYGKEFAHEACLAQ